MTAGPTAAPRPDEGDSIIRPTAGPWQVAGRRLLRKRLALGALALIILFYAVGMFAPILAPSDFREQDLNNTLSGPSWDHPFGTDRLGRDQFSRVIWSARTTIIVTIATVLTGSLFLSVGLGMLAGYLGGKVDTVIMRAGEAFGSLPALPMLILINATMRDRVTGWVDNLEGVLSSDEPAFYAIVAVLAVAAAATLAVWLATRAAGRAGGWLALAVTSVGAILVLWGMQAVFAMPGSSDYFLIFGALSLFFWVGGARVIRSQVLALRETEYVTAAR